MPQWMQSRLALVCSRVCSNAVGTLDPPDEASRVQEPLGVELTLDGAHELERRRVVTPHVQAGFYFRVHPLDDQVAAHATAVTAQLLQRCAQLARRATPIPAIAPVEHRIARMAEDRSLGFERPASLL